MKQRLAEYAADLLSAFGIKNVFSVVGGGAMYLNDAFGHHASLHVCYHHHEQAAAIAAEIAVAVESFSPQEKSMKRRFSTRCQSRVAP